MSASSDRYESLGEALARAQDDLRASLPFDRAAVRARLVAAANAPSRRHGWTIATTTLALVASVLAMLWFSRTDTLTFELAPDGETGVAGAWIAAPADDERTLRFSDGSSIGLHPRARARVATLQRSGAHVVLESGRADVQIESAAGGAWQIDAGPYRIEVTGTRLFVGWDPATESFELLLHEGAVVVEGPQLDGARSVEAGQLLRIVGRDERLAAATDLSRPEAPAAVAARPSEPAATTSRVEAPAIAGSPATPSPTPARRRVAPQSSTATPAPAPAPDAWKELARAGDYAGALAAAQTEGFENLCERLPSRELLRLADVARFARKPTQAIAVLVAVRRRFPDTEAAATAAFERGRIALAGDGSSTGSGGSAEAASWFETYLDERPRGPLAREAMGRWMEALEAGGKGSAARATARRYLDLHPTGPHADLARRLLDGGG